MMEVVSKSTIPCRVCQNDSRYWFSKTILSKYEVGYYQCSVCGHIQTEEPYWLEEAYFNLNFRRDVGMVSRSIKAAQLTLALAYTLKISPNEICLDYGAGTGLLVRYCRDHGLNFYFHDRYSKNVFAIGFEIDSLGNFAKPVLLTAFEVAEHLPNPTENFKEIFAYKPDYVLISTELYANEGKDWWYFLDDGQHVAVYTEQSLHKIGAQNGYYLYTDSRYHLFSLSPLPTRIVKKLRRYPDRKAHRYKKKYGSRIDSDFKKMLRA